MIPTCEPEVYGPEPGADLADADARCIRQEAIIRLLDWLTSGRVGALAVGRRVLILAHALRPKGTQAALAKRLGLSPAAVSKGVNTLRAANPHEH